MFALGAGLPAFGAGPAIEAITIKWRDGALPDGASSPADLGLAALDGALQLPVLQATRLRDGALRFELARPISIDEARAAVNRVRLLPQVLYAKVDEAAATSSRGAAATPERRAIDRMIVKYRDPALSASATRNESLSSARLERLTAQSGRPVAHERAMSGGAWVVRLFSAVPDDEAESLARQIENDPDVEFVEPDRLMRPMLTPNDTNYATQWDLQTPATAVGGANLPPAWDITTGSAGIVVAVIDTGILPHPDLAGRYIGGYDMISDSRIANDGDGRDSNPADTGDWTTAAEDAGTAAGGFFRGCGVEDSSWHGTHVAGTIAAASNNAQGVTGINWVSKILPVRVLGKCGGYTSDIADAIVWAAGLPVAGVPLNPNPARAMNLSLGGSGSCGSTFQNAINAALGANAVIAVAAGNSNTNASNSSPGNCAGVITVAATQATGARASYSNYGSSVEIAAPGGGDGKYILSTLNHGTTAPDLSPAGWYYEYYQGTSMAAPHVAGIVSLMLSVNPALTPAQVLSKIQTTARAFPTGTGRDCTTAQCGAGIIDAGAAVASASGAFKTTSTTSLTGSGSPSNFGAPVALTATVAGSAPTGSVDFKDGGTSIAGCATAALSGSGNSRAATCSVNNLVVGVHSLTASYSGDAGNTASTSAALSQVVKALGPAPSSTTLVSSLNPANVGDNVTFTATVTGAAPTGMVKFTDGGTTINGCSAVAVNGSGNSRTAACTTNDLPGKSHTIAATYSGDAANAASTSAPLNQTIRGTKQRGP